MILYASEVTDPKKSVLAMLDNLINRVVLKIFEVSEKLVIMVALCNRETIYIFMLWFVLLSSSFFFFLA